MPLKMWVMRSAIPISAILRWPHAFFDHREDHARSFERFALAAFCAVQRPADHPLKPHDYVSLDAFWRKRGFEKAEGLVTSFSWKDIDQPEETAKPMQFWLKALA